MRGDAKDVVVARGINNVLVSTVNQAPVFPDQDDETEGRQTAQERSIAENTDAGANIGDRVVATDEDASLTYSLGGPDAASFDIDRGETLATAGQLKTKAALNKESKDTYTVTVTAADSLSASSTITVTIKVTDVDEMPDLEGEAPEEYAENGTAALATFRATDPEGKSIVWSLAGSDNVEFTIENGVLRFKNSPDYEDAGNTDHMYEVTVQASDGGATPATKDVNIEITNVEESGTVMLSTLQPQVGRLITAMLDDPDDETASTVTWQWYRGSSPISGATNGAGTVSSTYTPDAGDVGSALRPWAMYDDAEGDDKTARGMSYRSVRTAPQDNTVPVVPDQDPGAQGPQTAQSREVAENTPAGTNIGAPVVANDPGDVLTYSLSGTGEASFDIVRSSGQLQTKAALDFETTNSYTVTVTATDPFGAEAEVTVTITVTNVNEAPTFTAGATSMDHEEGTRVLDADATDNAATAAEYTITDDDTADDAADLKWTLSGADAGKFELDGSGATRTLAFEDAPNYESPGDSGGNNVYEVTVVVTDSEGNTAERTVTIKVTNMEEAGVVELSTLQPRISFAITATLTDEDNIAAGSVSWQWYKGTVTQEDLATLDETECVAADTNDCFIKGAASATYTPVANDVQDTLVAVALYTDGSPNEGDAKDFAMMATANQILADTRNKAPVFPDQDDEMEGDQTDQVRMVGENVPAIGTNNATDPVRDVGTPVVAMDSVTANDGMTTDEVLTYSLGGPDADSFSIHRSTAQISTKADVPLDKEKKDTYTVTVTATDPSGLEATITVTIMVTNVDEAPEIMRAPDANVAPEFASATTSRTVAENTAAGMDIGNPVAANDANGDTLAYTLRGTDAASFDIDSGTGQITVGTGTTLDFEATQNTYMVIVTATDPDSVSDMVTVTITVTNMDEEGTVTMSSTTPAVGTALTASLTDLDSPDGVTGATWQWARSSDGLTGWANIPGAMSASYTPVDPDDVGMYLRAMASYTDGHGSGKDAMEMTASVVVTQATTPLDRYDANKDEELQLEELFAAIDEYFDYDDRITFAELEELLDLYFDES